MSVHDIEHQPGDDASTLGVRLRVIRTVFGLSQRALARRAGVTNGTVSLVEQGQVSPSVASLEKLVAGLGLSLAEFFTMDIRSRPVPFYKAESLVEIGGGGVSLRVVPSAVASSRLQIARKRYEPGSDTGPELLSHPGEEAGVVVHGTIWVKVGAHERQLGPGDAYHFDSRIPHRFRNPGGEICEVVSASTPRTA